MKTPHTVSIAYRTNKPKIGSVPILVSYLLFALVLISISNLAHAACVVNPSAWVLVSTLECDNRFELDVAIEEEVRVVASDLTGGSNIGARTQVLSSDLSNATVGADSHIIKAQIGALDLPVQIGSGSETKALVVGFFESVQN